ILDCLLDIDGVVEALCNEVRRQARQVAKGASHAQVARDRKKLKTLKKGLDRLLDFIEAGQDSPDIQARIAKRQAEIAEVEQRLKAVQDLAPSAELPTPEQVREKLAEWVSIVEASGEDLLPWLRVLMPRIEVYPVKIKGAAKLALEARFDLKLLHLLPSEWATFLRHHGVPPKAAPQADPVVKKMAMIVTDLPRYVRIAPEAKRLRDRGLTLKAIAHKLGSQKNIVWEALKLMDQQNGEELEILEVTKLRDRRRGNHPSRQPKTEKAIPGTGGLTERVVQTVKDLHEQGLSPHAIAVRVGCRVNTVRRALTYFRRPRRTGATFKNARPVKKSPAKSKRPRRGMGNAN
ncbi:hypothetical protein LCGC14_2660720, partial [marine sediment metagenome]